MAEAVKVPLAMVAKVRPAVAMALDLVKAAAITGKAATMAVAITARPRAMTAAGNTDPMAKPRETMREAMARTKVGAPTAVPAA